MTTPEIHAKGSQRRTLTVCDSQTPPEGETRSLIRDWLTANGVDPQDVASPAITLEFVPRCAGSVTDCQDVSSAPWWIALTQRYRNAAGDLEVNALTNAPADVQRTIPLTVAPPLRLVPEWEHEATYWEEDPYPRLMRLSEVQELRRLAQEHAEGAEEDK